MALLTSIIIRNLTTEVSNNQGYQPTKNSTNLDKILEDRKNGIYSKSDREVSKVSVIEKPKTKTTVPEGQLSLF